MRLVQPHHSIQFFDHTLTLAFVFFQMTSLFAQMSVNGLIPAELCSALEEMSKGENKSAGDSDSENDEDVKFSAPVCGNGEGAATQ